MIDLHLHFDGSLTANEIITLADIQHVVLPANNISELTSLISEPENCTNLNEYLRCFDIPQLVLQSREAITYAFYSFVKRLADLKMLYAEIRFAPQFHTKGGLNQFEVVEAALSGINSALQENKSISIGLILCYMRGDKNDDENLKTLKTAEKYYGYGVCAVDLAGAEGIFKTSLYKEIFERTKAAGINYTIHAGEADGIESIWDAIRFGAKRIGHGVRSAEDEELMQYISENGITLELCPTSNLQTKAVMNIKSFPIKEFLKREMKATINTDNMTVSNTTIFKEFELLETELGLTETEKNKLLLNSIDSAFTSLENKEALRKKIT